MRDLTLDIESSAWAELREFLHHPTYIKVQLQQVCTIVKAHSSMGKAQFASEGVPYIHYGQLHGKLHTCAHTACTFADPASCAQATWAQRGDVILTGVSENLDGVAKPLAWLGEQPAVVSGGALVLQHDLDPLYLSCALQSSDFRQQLSKVVNKSTLLNLRTTRLGQLSINIPPLRIQELIGKFLSLGVANAASLDAEFNLRAQQIQFLTDYLFDFRGERHLLLDACALKQVRQVQLGDLCMIRTSGNLLTKDYIAEEGIPFIHYGHLFRDYFIATESCLSHIAAQDAPALNVQQHDIVIANASQIPDYLARGVVWNSAEPAVAGNHCTILRPLRPHEEIIPEYLSFFLHSSCFTQQRAALQTGVTVVSLNNRALQRVLVPVPSIEVQQEIVRLLYQAHDLLRHPQHGLLALRQLEEQRWKFYCDWLTGVV